MSCGYIGADDDRPEPHRVLASPACYAALGEVAGAHTFVASSGDFVHQVAMPVADPIREAIGKNDGDDVEVRLTQRLN